MKAANLQFSAEEAALLGNSEWILTKNRVLEQLQAMLGRLSERMRESAGMALLPPEITCISPKISKGDRFRGLPWLVLDYPRFFTAADVFAIRSFFWWGHFFSSTLHLKGRYMQAYGEGIKEKLIKGDWFFYTGADEWDHDLGSPDYRALHTVSVKEQLSKASFVKLGRSLPVANWSVSEEFLWEGFEILLRVAED